MPRMRLRVFCGVIWKYRWRHRKWCRFFDEIQDVPGWEKFVRRLVDTVSRHVFITGSSARLLSREIATALRGRTLAYTLFPFSFSEYMRAQGAGALSGNSHRQRVTGWWQGLIAFLRSVATPRSSRSMRRRGSRRCSRISR